MKRELSDLLDRYLASWCGVDRERLADRSLALGELGVDALALGEMMGDLERRFGLRIDDPATLLSKTPDQVVDALHQRIPFRAARPADPGA